MTFANHLFLSTLSCHYVNASNIHICLCLVQIAFSATSIFITILFGSFEKTLNSRDSKRK